MSEVESILKKLVLENGQAGPDMTHGLKTLGNGDMQTGIKRMVNFFFEDGKQCGYKLGKKSGRIEGVLGTIFVASLAAGGIYVIARLHKRKSEKQLEEEGKEILNIFQQSEIEAVKRGVQEEKILEIPEYLAEIKTDEALRCRS